MFSEWFASSATFWTNACLSFWYLSKTELQNRNRTSYFRIKTHQNLHTRLKHTLLNLSWTHFNFLNASCYYKQRFVSRSDRSALEKLFFTAPLLCYRYVKRVRRDVKPLAFRLAGYWMERRDERRKLWRLWCECEDELTVTNSTGNGFKGRRTTRGNISSNF